MKEEVELGMTRWEKEKEEKYLNREEKGRDKDDKEDVAKEKET